MTDKSIIERLIALSKEQREAVLRSLDADTLAAIAHQDLWVTTTDAEWKAINASFDRWEDEMTP
jgi:hypothetical protein